MKFFTHKHIFRMLNITCLASALLFLTLPVSAASGLRAVLSQPVLAQFPSMILYLDVYDAQSRFVGNLKSDQITLLENDTERPLNEATRIEPGLHTILALNLSPTLSNRPAGITRFEELYLALTGWLNGIHSEVPNLYSLVSNDSALAQHLSDPTALNTILQDYQPNLFNYEPDLTSLKYAIDVASQQPTPPENGKQVIFYLTPLPLDRELDQLPVLAARAADLNVSICVWLVAKETSDNSPAADALRQLATRTGGQFFLLTENIEAPSPEIYFEPLRFTYRLRYTSAINQSGFHSLKVNIERGVQQASSQDVAFEINLQPPEVTIIALPPQIQLTWVTPDEGGSKILYPDFLTLQLGITFPDGYSRQLESTRLLFDGKEIVTVTQEPFEFLGLPLGSYIAAGTHSIQVEVEDILGFHSQSDLRQVQVIVEQRYPGFFGKFLTFLNSGGWIALATLLVLGLIIAFITFRPRFPRLVGASSAEDQELTDDPLTQLVYIPEETIISKNRSGMETASQPQAVPRLVWIGDDPPPPSCADIHIQEGETGIGSDAEQVKVVLKLPSVSPYHAVIRVTPQGATILADHGSEAGTWVNYAPISSKGIVLHHGDLVHIGKAAFRFELSVVNHR
ncbi:MAG TPA: FHA domain-containing protein [Anaerolineae bacterium]|nr:FHA domain-containing protein [Anaerolineae bacterium]